MMLRGPGHSGMQGWPGERSEPAISWRKTVWRTTGEDYLECKSTARQLPADRCARRRQLRGTVGGGGKSGVGLQRVRLSHFLWDDSVEIYLPDITHPSQIGSGVHSSVPARGTCPPRENVKPRFASIITFWFPQKQEAQLSQRDRATLRVDCRARV